MIVAVADKDDVNSTMFRFQLLLYRLGIAVHYIDNYAFISKHWRGDVVCPT